MTNRRQSAIDHRHINLGCTLEAWGGVGTAYDYANQSTQAEHDAIRDSVGVFDVTGLHKRWITGTDAEAVLGHCCVHDVTKLVDGQAGYSVLLTDEGTIHDDSIIYRMNSEKYLFVTGTGQSGKYLDLSAEGKNCSIKMDDNIQNLAVQGPKSVDVLDAICADDMTQLKMFRHMSTTINGHSVRISRTGFTGERGYEIYCDHSVLEEIYDSVLEAGKSFGIMTTGFNCLDKVRIESALLFYPYDMNENTTIWEVGLDWTVPKNKEVSYRGQEASTKAKGEEKVHLVGLVVDHSEAVSDTCTLSIDGKPVGSITSSAWSHRMNQSLSLAHIAIGHEAIGSVVKVKGEGIDTTAVITAIAFYDPTKQKIRG